MNKRNSFVAITLSLVVLAACTSEQRFASPVQESGLITHVDPYIGSADHGHVFVGASVPFGAVQAGPNNFHKGWDWCSGYHYSDSIIKGFTQTHLNGTGCADLGDVLIMPYTGDVKLYKGTQQHPDSGYASRYSHDEEIARLAYYTVMLKDHNVKVELTATERVAFHKYTFPKNKPAHIIIDVREGNATEDKIDAYCFLQKVNDSTLIGFRNVNSWARDRRVYFAIRSNIPFEEFAMYKGYTKTDSTSMQADTVKGLISFKQAPKEVMLKVGLSSVSGEKALANILEEIKDWDFNKTVEQSNDKWNNALACMKAESKNEAQKRIFYTALYHTMITPSLYNDHDGSYRGTDKNVYEKAPFTNYTTFSLWDTYRAYHPLMSIIQPDKVNDFVNSMLAIYQQQRKLPIWHLHARETDCMVGYSAVNVIADAYLKGFRGFDTTLALEAMKASSTRDDMGVKYLKELGYIPSDKENEAVAKAMEYALADWGIAQVAKQQGREDDYKKYAERALYYKKYFDANTKFMRGIDSKTKKFVEPFDPFKSIHRQNDYTEGNAWQYTWLVPQDVEGLINLFGSDQAFITKLDSLFVVTGDMGEHASADISGLIGMYAHGNEPVHHVAYLYPFAGEQWKTAEKVRQICSQFYTDKNTGLCGNEDCGQMSAWYLISALGFYQVNPSNGVYVFGTPLFDKITLNIGHEKTFTVVANNNSDKNIYIQSVKLNGADYNKSYIKYADIMKGGTLEFTMGDQPNKEFGKAPENRPKSAL